MTTEESEPLPVEEIEAEPAVVEPTEPAKVSVALTPADWMHVKTILQVGTQRAVDNLIAKHNSLVEQIDAANQP